MKATTPPRCWASARTCWQSVVLPDDSGPKISVIRPRGIPPTPRARSSAIDPVGIESTDCRSADPSFMIEPRPNCFSIDRIAASTARPRSARARSPLRSSIPRSPVIAILSIAPVLFWRRMPSATVPSGGHLMLLGTPLGMPLRESGDGRPAESALLRLVLFVPRLARLPDQLDVLRRLEERLELLFRGAVFRLLLGFPGGAVSRAHGLLLHVPDRMLRTGPSRRLHRGFTVRHPPGAQPQFGECRGEGAGPQCVADPGTFPATLPELRLRAG